MTHSTYIGTELELFSKAVVWKSYLRKQISPFLGKRVLEVGAGIGGSTTFLCNGSQTEWVCLEPDASLASQLTTKIETGSLPGCCRAVVGTVAQVLDSRFDTILYIDVLEHIQGDVEELDRACKCLAPKGRIVVLSPAHPFLFSPFDTAVGHFRRYTKRALRKITPSGTELVRLRYLDAIGMLASVGNRLLLQSSQPTPAQLAFWDGYLVRASRLIDPLTRYLIGKSVLAVWQKEVADESVR